MSLSERGWIATARLSESRRYMMVKQVGSPQKSMHPPFSDKFHLTISSPRSFAVFFFSQATIFPKKSLKVPFFLPRLWFSIHICIFHHFPPKRLWLFYDFSTFSQHFPPLFVVPRSTVAPPTGVAPRRRGPRQGPSKPARCG